MKPESVEKINRYNKELKSEMAIRLAKDNIVEEQISLREMIIEVVKEEKLFDTFAMEYNLKRLKKIFGSTEVRRPKR